MFVHKSKPFALGFACAAALAMGLAATAARADSRSNCDEPDCKYPVGGIVQKERDGVNYFYGGSYVESPSLSYIYVKGDALAQPTYQPIRSAYLYATGYAAPFSKHRFRMQHDHWNWNRRHPGPLDLPGLPPGGLYNPGALNNTAP